MLALGYVKPLGLCNVQDKRLYVVLSVSFSADDDYN